MSVFFSLERSFRSMCADTQGASIAEYAVLLSMIAIGCIVGLRFFSTSFNNFFARHVNEI